MTKENKEKQLYIDFGEEFLPTKRDKFTDSTKKKILHDIHDDYPYVPEYPTDEEDAVPFDPTMYSSENEKLEKEELILNERTSNLSQDKESVLVQKKEFSLSETINSFMYKPDGEILDNNLFVPNKESTQERKKFFTEFTQILNSDCYFKSLDSANEWFSSYLKNLLIYITRNTSNKTYFSELELKQYTKNILTRNFFGGNIWLNTLKKRRTVFWQKFRVLVLKNHYVLKPGTFKRDKYLPQEKFYKL